MSTSDAKAPLPSRFSFDDRFVREMPGDPADYNLPRQVHGAFYSHVTPTPVSAPKLLAHSAEVAADLGLTVDDLRSDEVVSVLAGNRIFDGMKPYSACYGGHQFGHWAGQLGDGRAITLGEMVTPGGATLEVQLKGAGPTPYSRRADGRAVLRSSVREFLCSEAMHHLGVPTTRALALVLTGDEVLRDMLYDGNAEMEPGAIVTRISPSFVRFGSFELPASRNEHALVKKLADHVIAAHYSHLPNAAAPTRDTYRAFLVEVAERTARMVAAWMRVGFVHGVMNTDNMSILGLTIDYGPYGWLEGFDPAWTPNTTDASGRRYRFGAQPRIAAWNVASLVDAFSSLLDEGAADAVMDAYAEAWSVAELDMYARKLGIRDLRLEGEGENKSPDYHLLEGLFEVFKCAEIDMTLFYRGLANVPTDTSLPRAEHEARSLAAVRDAFYAPSLLETSVGDSVYTWLSAWAVRAKEAYPSDAERIATMNAANPKYVLRNWLCQNAIDAAAKGNPAEVELLLEVMRRPYEERPGLERFAEKRPEWARHRVGCSMLSCSS